MGFNWKESKYPNGEPRGRSLTLFTDYEITPINCASERDDGRLRRAARMRGRGSAESLKGHEKKRDPFPSTQKGVDEEYGDDTGPSPQERFNRPKGFSITGSSSRDD